METNLQTENAQNHNPQRPEGFENWPLEQKEVFNKGTENVAKWFNGLGKDTQKRVVLSLIGEVVQVAPIETEIVPKENVATTEETPSSMIHEVAEGENFGGIVRKALEDNV